MNNENDKPKYIKVYDKRKKKFGIKAEGQKGWHVEPMFDELGIRQWADESSETWFRQGERYGYYNISDRKVTISPIYGFPLYFNEKGYAITWRDHKAGVIDKEEHAVIPFVYDEIESRYRRVPTPEQEQRTITTSDGTVLHVGPTSSHLFYGFACFTNEGDMQAYDADCQPDTFHDWEEERLAYKPDYENKESENMSLEELERVIKKEYVTLLELGYEHHKDLLFTREHRDRIDTQEQTVRSLLRDRRQKMNSTWVHDVENARRIGRTNRLLMRAVHKAITLGEKTTKSLQWMENVRNKELYEVTVCVYPQWQDSSSDIRYGRLFTSADNEQDRLIEEGFNVADTHIWNIIAAMGHGVRHNDTGVCFEFSAYEYDHGLWDERELTGDDGQSWDEGLHFPAYQDEYFTRPFHHLYCDMFCYSLEDICNINDFCTHVNVCLRTSEQDKYDKMK